MNNNNQHGLGTSTRIPRADAGKNVSAASLVKSGPACFHRTDKAEKSAPPIPSTHDGLPCANPPGADLAGGGISNRSQPLFFQSGDHFPNEFASSFPSQSSSLPRGVKP